jgi:prephenate dehydratase
MELPFSLYACDSSIPNQQNITRFNLREKKERIAQIAGLTLVFSLARKAPGHLVMTEIRSISCIRHRRMD